MDQCVTRSALIWRSVLIGIGLCLAATAVSATQAIEGRYPVSQQHPRLLGPLQRLQQLKEVRPEAYGRMERVAREQEAEDHAKMISLALVSAVEGDAALGREAVEMALQYVDGPIRTGHITFGAGPAAYFVFDKKFG
jgi:hypothetical protein